MYATNTTLNIIDSAFSVIEVIADYDYVKSGERIITIIATAAAIIIGVATYCTTALQLFWEEHGESIMTNALRAVIIAADFAGNCYYTGRKLRVIANSATAQFTDRIYYTAIV